MQQIVLDTETTGLDTKEGHRIIEIGCVELHNRRPTKRVFHEYLQPDREIDEGALAIHGITNEFLADKPRFANIAEAFLDFICGAELIIHNAPFDIGFLDYELSSLGSSRPAIGEICRITDTLSMARRMHPGQRNSLDALCKRYGIDNTHRELHGALLDVRILADVYLAMTGGQSSLILNPQDVAMPKEMAGTEGVRRLPPDRTRLQVVHASEAEWASHRIWLQKMKQVNGGRCLWSEGGENTDS